MIKNTSELDNARNREIKPTDKDGWLAFVDWIISKGGTVTINSLTTIWNGVEGSPDSCVIEYKIMNNKVYARVAKK